MHFGGELVRITSILVLISLALIYSVVNTVLLVIFKIQNLLYWSFWVFNTLTLIFGLGSVIAIKEVSSLKNEWILQEFLMNLSMTLIAVSNILTFLLTLSNFITHFTDTGLWTEKEVVGVYEAGIVYILTFSTFMVNLAPYLAILYHSRKVHLDHRAKGKTCS